MENSVGVGFMGVFAVTGSVVILAHQIHKRLLSDFMKDIEFEFKGSVKRTTRRKKTVRFADDVVEPSSNNKEYRKRHLEKHAINSSQPPNFDQNSNVMPLNRQALYRGIIKSKSQFIGS